MLVTVAVPVTFTELSNALPTPITFTETLWAPTWRPVRVHVADVALIVATVHVCLPIITVNFVASVPKFVPVRVSVAEPLTDVGETAVSVGAMLVSNWNWQPALASQRASFVFTKTFSGIISSPYGRVMNVIVL